MTATSKEQRTASTAETAAGKNGFSLISDEKLIELYLAMVKCRMVAERAGLLIGQGKVAGDFHGAVGLEAIAAGVIVDLLPEDAFSPSPGDIMLCLVKGVPLDRMFGDVSSSPNGHGKRRSASVSLGYAPLSVLPFSANTAAQFNIACGVALANKMTKNGRIAVAFCEAGVNTREAWCESLAFAGLNGLPILFVCQSVTSAEPARPEAQSAVEDVVAGALACNVPAITVDGEDVVAVYRVACESIARARQGRGPTLIHCAAFRLHGQGGIDPKRTRGPKHDDPIQKMETYLDRKGLFNIGLKRKVAAAFRRELDAATGFLRN
jgi:pyruvate dehydrogenase E1 component alpha subunit